MFWSDVKQLLEAVLLIVAAVLPVVNPLGSGPIFLSMTEGCDRSTRAELARRIALYSFGLLLGSMLFGSFVLLFFGLSVPIVQVAGGAVVCALGWRILADEGNNSATVTADAQQARHIALGRAFYPLTLPVTIDAGVISVAITVGANHSHAVRHSLIQFFAAVLGAVIISLTISVTYRYMAPLSRWVGNMGMQVILRLSAFITLCIGVGICWNGVKALLVEIGLAVK